MKAKGLFFVWGVVRWWLWRGEGAGGSGGGEEVRGGGGADV